MGGALIGVFLVYEALTSSAVHNPVISETKEETAQKNADNAWDKATTGTQQVSLDEARKIYAAKVAADKAVRQQKFDAEKQQAAKEELGRKLSVNAANEAQLAVKKRQEEARIKASIEEMYEQDYVLMPRRPSKGGYTGAGLYTYSGGMVYVHNRQEFDALDSKVKSSISGWQGAVRKADLTNAGLDKFNDVDTYCGYKDGARLDATCHKLSSKDEFNKYKSEFPQADFVASNSAMGM